MTGYFGRVGILEVWRLRRQGMPTLLEDHLAKVAEGIITLAKMQAAGGFGFYAPGDSER
jgi:hypothetical protein